MNKLKGDRSIFGLLVLLDMTIMTAVNENHSHAMSIQLVFLSSC